MDSIKLQRAEAIVFRELNEIRGLEEIYHILLFCEKRQGALL